MKIVVFASIRITLNITITESNDCEFNKFITFRILESSSWNPDLKNFLNEY